MKKFLAAAGILVSPIFFSTAALAGDGGFNGSVDLNFTNISGSGQNTDAIGGNLVLQTQINGNWGAQGELGYYNLSGSGSDTNLFKVGGVLGYTDPGYRLAANIRNYNFSNSVSSNFTTFGVGGEFYHGPNQSWTFGATVGGITGDESGFYVGGFGKYYPCRQFSTTLAIDHTSFGSNDYQTSFGAALDYLPFKTTPLRLSVGYTYVDVSGGDHFHVIQLALKYQFNAAGSTPEVDLMTLDRSNEYSRIGWGPATFNYGY